MCHFMKNMDFLLWKVVLQSRSAIWMLSKKRGFILANTVLFWKGKSYLLRTLFKNHLLENGVDDKHIIEMAFDIFIVIYYNKANG